MTSWPQTPPTGNESSEAAPDEPAPRDLETEAQGRSPEPEDGPPAGELDTPALPTMVELDVLSAELDDIDTVLARMDDRESDPASD